MPLPDESPRGSIANLINRFENQTKRATSQQGTYSVSSRSSSVVSQTSSVGDATTAEAKEKREWPPRAVQALQQTPPLPGDKPGFVMPSYLRPNVNTLASTVANSLSRTSSNGAGGPPGESVAKDAKEDITVDTPKATTPPNGAGTPVQSPPMSISRSSSSTKSDSSSSKATKAGITPVDTQKAQKPAAEEEAASENGEVEPDTPKPGVRRKASTLTVSAAAGTVAGGPKSAIGKTPVTAKPPGTARHPPTTTKPPVKPAAATAATKTPAKAAPSSFKGPATTAAGSAAPRQTKSITPQTSTQSLKPQHTGGSVTSTASTRKPASKPTPATPSRAKTPAKASSAASSAAARAKSPSRAKTPVKMPTTGLYAPTAASLAKMRNAPPMPQATPVKKVLSSEVADRLSKPTQASLSKARAPVATATPAKATNSPRPSFGGPGTPVKKAASSAGTPLKSSSSTTPMTKAASASPAAKTAGTPPKKGTAAAVKAGAGAAVAAAVSAVAAATSAKPEEKVVDEKQTDAEPVPEPVQEPAVAEPVPESPKEEPAAEEVASEEPQLAPTVSEEEESAAQQEEASEEEAGLQEPNGAKAGTDLEDIVNLLEFTPVSKIRETMQADTDGGVNGNGNGAIEEMPMSPEDVQAEIPDEHSE